MTTLDWLMIAGAGIFILALVIVLAIRIWDADFWLDLVSGAADRIWDAVGPKIINKIMARMPPDEEAAWNKFNRSNPDKEAIRAWKKAYREREKKRRAAIDSMNKEK